MLEIVRARTWEMSQSFVDDDTGTPSDLSEYVEIRSQIRDKVAVRNKKNIFFHPLIATVDVTRIDNVTFSRLSRAQTTLLAPGDYLIDMLGIDVDGKDTSLNDPEPVRVLNRPTYPLGGDIVSDDPVVISIPNFVDIAETALVD